MRPDVLGALLRHCQSKHIMSECRAVCRPGMHRRRPNTSFPALHDPTSLTKMQRILPAIASDPLALRPLPRLLSHYSPNQLELSTLYRVMQETDLTSTSDYFACLDQLDIGEQWRQALSTFGRAHGSRLDWVVEKGLAQMMVSLLPWVDNVWLKCGERGVLHLGLFSGQSPATTTEATQKRPTRITHRLRTLPTTWLSLAHYPASVIAQSEMVSTTGAGDSFVGGLAAGIAQSTRPDGQPSEHDVWRALDCARLSLRSSRAVAEDVTDLRTLRRH
jgi:pseudouridine-5'-phosphate glycosidase/pseudouridine kinase